MDERISTRPGVADDQHTNKVHDQYGEETALKDAGSDAGVAYDPINVKVINDTAALTLQTVIIPASTSAVVSAQRILSADQFRAVAYVSAVNVAVIIATSEAEAQAVGNIASAVPTGASQAIGAWSPPITHKGEIWAANTSTSDAAMVSIMVSRGDVRQS